MEQLDQQIAQRVWQRVHSRGTEDSMVNILPLLQEEATDLSRYRQLSAILHKPELKQLVDNALQCVAILRGILSFSSGKAPEITPYPLPKELPAASVRRSYSAVLQRIGRYESLSHQPEYAPGFMKLAQLNAQRCQLLLQLLGDL